MSGSEPNESKTLLVGFINRLKTLADEIADIQADCADVRKEAKNAGFDAVKIGEVVRWLRKVDKHGRTAMDDAEAVFDLYRQAVDARSTSFDDMMTEARDKALLKIFAPQDQVEPKLNARTKRMRDALAVARGEKSARAGL